MFRVDTVCEDCKNNISFCICDDRDSKRKPCTCIFMEVAKVLLQRHISEDCPRHGIIASNARQNRYWQRVGRD